MGEGLPIQPHSPLPILILNSQSDGTLRKLPETVLAISPVSFIPFSELAVPKYRTFWHLPLAQNSSQLIILKIFYDVTL